MELRDTQRFASVHGKSISLFVLFFISVFPGSREAQALRSRVTYEKGVMSVTAKNANLRDLLAIVAERTGIQISSPEPFQETVTVEFSNLPLEQGLSLILKNVNHIFMFSKPDSKAEATLYRVLIFPKEIKSPAAPVTRAAKGRMPVPQEEAAGRVGEPAENTVTGEGQEPDPEVKKYQMQLQELEQELAQVEENSPRAKAITDQMTSIQEQMEKRLQGSEQP